MGEANIFFRLRPTWNQKRVDGNSVLSAHRSLAHRRFFGPLVRWIEHVQNVVFEMRCWQAVGDQNDLTIGRVLAGQQPTGQSQ